MLVEEYHIYFLSYYIFIDYISVGKCSKRRNLPPGSKRARLGLACQAVENMFTSGGRSYSGSISSLTRRNLPCI